MKNYKAVVSYRGDRFLGFERQEEGRTVQGAIENALSTLFPEGFLLHGAGRTDAGVHAEGQVVSFRAGRAFDSEERLMKCLNHLLPSDIAVLSLVEVPLSFDARKSATGKRYCYRLLKGTRNPLVINAVSLDDIGIHDLSRLPEACSLLKGNHDFRNFTSKKGDLLEFRRDISIDILEDNEVLSLVFTASGFMTYMVRFLVQAILDLCAGKVARETVEDLLERPLPRRIYPRLAPAEGLTLQEVLYER